LVGFLQAAPMLAAALICLWALSDGSQEASRWAGLSQVGVVSIYLIIGSVLFVMGLSNAETMEGFMLTFLSVFVLLVFAPPIGAIWALRVIESERIPQP